MAQIKSGHSCGCLSGGIIVYRLLNPLGFVAFKMGRLRGGPSRTGAKGATKQPTHFQRNPPGRGQLAVFPRCSLDRDDPDSGTSLAP